ncbi:hypothetical protein ACOALZ_01860 [Nocardiopsis algeriensis]|uniref:hypothetical protein n=1 Tax=Nocardiopsis algeriensis TaxID=1478215 RepID=UPI003B43BFF0
MRGSGGPRAFWEREQGPVPRPGLPSPPRGPYGSPPPAGTRSASHPEYGSPPAGPPARVGGAVAALVVAVLSLVALVAFTVWSELWFLLLAANAPGVALGITALLKIPDAPEVERYIRYTWACNFAYMAVLAVFLVSLAALAVFFVLLGT